MKIILLTIFIILSCIFIKLIEALEMIDWGKGYRFGFRNQVPDKDRYAKCNER